MISLSDYHLPGAVERHTDFRDDTGAVFSAGHGSDSHHVDGRRWGEPQTLAMLQIQQLESDPTVVCSDKAAFRETSAPFDRQRRIPSCLPLVSSWTQASKTRNCKMIVWPLTVVGAPRVLLLAHFQPQTLGAAPTAPKPHLDGLIMPTQAGYRRSGSFSTISATLLEGEQAALVRQFRTGQSVAVRIGL